MAAVRLDALRNLARLYADGRPGGANAFVVDADLNSIINLKIAGLYDMMVEGRGQERYAKDGTINIVANTSVYVLAADFYILLSLVLPWDARNNEPMKPTSQYERSFYQNWSQWSRWSPKAYRLGGDISAPANPNTIEIFPMPTSAIAATYRYIPLPVPLALDTDTFNFVNGFENLVALAAAIDLRAIAEKPNDNLVALYAQQEQRVRDLLDKRDAGQAEQVIDVQPEQRAREWSGDGRWIS